MKFKTLAIHGAHKPSEHLGAVMTPIYQTSTFAFKGVNQPGPYDYSRSGNPTRKALEDCLASLEGGCAGFAFATGMAAEATVCMMFRAGDTVIVHNDLYGGTYRLFQKVMAEKGNAARYVDLRDAAALEAALSDGAAAVWIESPTNPLMNLVDLRAVSDAAHAFAPAENQWSFDVWNAGDAGSTLLGFMLAGVGLTLIQPTKTNLALTAEVSVSSQQDGFSKNNGWMRSSLTRS